MKLTSFSRMKSMTMVGATLAITVISIMQFPTSKAAANGTKPTVVASPSPAPSASLAPRATTTKSAAPRTTTKAAAKSAPAAAQTLDVGLRGYVDMHTHPMAHLGFGKKLLHGAPDIGSLVPKGTHNCNPTDLRAKTMEEALGSCAASHGGWGLDNPCGDYVRAGMINYALDGDFKNIVPWAVNPHGDHMHPGAPDFKYWPHQTSKLHQQMWYEWIKRAHEGGLRVMVALAVNSQLLANAINGDSPTMDVSSSNLQITEIKSFVGRHNDFMEIAYSAADLRRIVKANKLAVILGMEIDDFGGFGAQGQAFKLFPEAFQRIQVKNEIKRVYDQGVRYLFPIHLTNNVFGGSALYNMMFNFANKHNNGNYMDIQKSGDSSIKYDINFVGDGPMGLNNALMLGIKNFTWGIGQIPAPCSNGVSCIGQVRCCGPAVDVIQSAMAADGKWLLYSAYQPGQINRQGLTPLGEYALQEMMKMGLMIDIDHMGIKSTDKALDIAEGFKSGYPLNMGHNGLRKNDTEHTGTERNVDTATLMRVANLGGMFGLGTADLTPQEFITEYRKVMNHIEGNSELYAALGVGTDANGLEPLPKNTPGLISDMFYGTNNLTKLKTGNRTWDYTKDGVAHYGLMNEFMRDVKTQPNGQQVWNHLWNSAEHFADMWEKCQKLSDK